MDNNDFNSRLGTYYNENQDLVTGLFSCGFLSGSEKITLLNSLIINRNGRNVLDLGCGKGGFVSLLKQIGYDKYTGIDLSTVALEKAKMYHPDCNFIKGDIHGAQNILKGSKWDLILICDVLEHSPDPKKLISDANKLLKVGGIILLVVPNYFNFIGIRKKLKEINSYEPDTYAPFCNERPQLHENFMTSFQVIKLLRNNSFKIIKSYGWDLITAFSIRPPYTEAGLKGFWARNGGKFTRWNRFFMNKIGFFTAFFSMYYIVSAEKIKD